MVFQGGSLWGAQHAGLRWMTSLARLLPLCGSDRILDLRLLLRQLHLLDRRDKIIAEAVLQKR